MKTIITATLLLLAFSAPSHAAKFYKWVDKDGVTHYTSQRPNDKPVETLNIRTGESHPTEKTVGDTEASEAEKIPPSEPESAPQQKTAKKIKDTKDYQRCEKAREIREILTNNNRVKVKDEGTGEYSYKSPEELQQWRDKNAEDISKYCP